ncbi:probable mediator of RNA polymerase II transcription subunit 37c [Papaver somniferum]|uniref:probable mediator of RNA polymerase II transcription subunit 37c n=1 Tax=Papaver somniferum TaxID=3469 RepID=UPI000E6FC19E|nr:probable mediator of RNA polymerase II transcription subunit 37c [Papaver somniferum]
MFAARVEDGDEGIPPAPRGVPRFTVCFNIDADGILTEVERLAREAERYKLEDEENKKKVELRNSFEEYIKDMRNAICDKRPPVGKSKIDAAVNKASQWLDSNELGDLEEIRDQMQEFENVCRPIIKRMKWTRPLSLTCAQAVKQ